MNPFLLKLYVYGRSQASERAIASLRQFCEQELEGQYELLIIDLIEQPRRALEDRIIATPTLVKEQPSPPRRVIGDLSSLQDVLSGLNLYPTPDPEEGTGES